MATECCTASNALIKSVCIVAILLIHGTHCFFQGCSTGVMSMKSQRLDLARVIGTEVTLKLCHSMTATFITRSNSSNLSH